jgi:hypothetical protein
MPRKLKVFRTSTGFHDAYVAAPSRKAALAAWGAEANLFARGVAEEVTDPELMKAPLARPGDVIRVSRGDLSAQLKALPPRKKAAAPRLGKAKARQATGPGSPPKRDRAAPPKRDRVAAAEKALEAALRRHQSEARELEAEREAITCKLEALRSKHGKELARLERARDAARDAYRAALERWSG